MGSNDPGLPFEPSCGVHASSEGGQRLQTFPQFPGNVPRVAHGQGYEQFIPDLPQTFVLGSDVHAATSRIFSREFFLASSPVGIISGSSATGKTSVAIALVREPAIQQQYSDGTIWMHCGCCAYPQRVLAELLVQVRAVQEAAVPRQHSASQVEHVLVHNRSMKGLTDELVKRLMGKRHLLVLDDVWEADIVRACKCLGLHILVTTFKPDLARSLKVVPLVGNDSTPFGSIVREHPLRILNRPAARRLLSTCYAAEEIERTDLDRLYHVIGRLPLELRLISLLLHLVQMSLNMSTSTLIMSIIKKLEASHRQLQVRLKSQIAAGHLSKSHLFCWRTIAVTIDVLPVVYRRRVLLLASIPSGAKVTKAHLMHLWDVSLEETTHVIHTLERINMLTPLRTPDGPRWFCSNLSHEYIVYWATLESPGSPVGQYRKVMLSSFNTLYALCNPFSEVAHMQLLPNSIPTCVTLALLRSAGRCCDDALHDAAVRCLHITPFTMREACIAISIACALQALEETEQAEELLLRSQAWFADNVHPNEPIHLQMTYMLAQLRMQQGQHKAALKLLEDCLLVVKKNERFTIALAEQLYNDMSAVALALHDVARLTWLADQRCVFAREQMGAMSTHYVHALIERVQVQLYVKAKPHRIMQSIKAAQQILDASSPTYNILHIRLKMCAVAYKLAIGNLMDMQVMLCHMFRRVQSLFDTKHDILISCMSDLGMCLNLQGNFSDAVDILTEASELVQNMKSKESVEVSLVVHSNLAVSLLALGRTTVALSFVRKVLNTTKQVPNLPITQHPTLYVWAVILLELQEVAAAKRLLNQLLDHYTSQDARSLVAASTILETMGVACMMEQDWHGALQNLTESIQVSDLLQQEMPARMLNLVETAKPHYLLSVVSAKLGQHEQARLHRAHFQELVKAFKSHPYLLWAENALAWQHAVEEGIVDASGRKRPVCSDPDLSDLEPNLAPRGQHSAPHPPKQA